MICGVRIWPVLPHLQLPQVLWELFDLAIPSTWLAGRFPSLCNASVSCFRSSIVCRSDCPSVPALFTGTSSPWNSACFDDLLLSNSETWMCHITSVQRHERMTISVLQWKGNSKIHRGFTSKSITVNTHNFLGLRGDCMQSRYRTPLSWALSRPSYELTWYVIFPPMNLPGCCHRGASLLFLLLTSWYMLLSLLITGLVPVPLSVPKFLIVVGCCKMRQKFENHPAVFVLVKINNSK